ncbi:MAG TPA: hypothetical protein PKE47_14965 [Verrucomicrobiota bacterium]|nr:hypothetical protein [Verrucomicrobiota bacterium]
MQRPPPLSRRAPAGGFTRADLLALLAGGALLFVLQAPLLAGGRESGRLARCVDNLRRLMTAWHDYADEHGHLVGAWSWSSRDISFTNWTGGSYLDLSRPRDPNNWDHDRFTKNSPLYPYLRDVSVFACPADPSRALASQPDGTVTSVPRLRSYAMNNWTGGPGWGNSGPWVPSNASGWRVMVRLGDFVDPGPARTFVLIEEREESINDGYFPVDMNGYPTVPGGVANGARFSIVDYPADWHDGGTAAAFADGSVRVQRWRDRRTTPRRFGMLLPLNVPSPHNPDVFWLQEHGTRWVP